MFFCLSVRCLLAYLKNHTSKLHQIFTVDKDWYTSCLAVFRDHDLCTIVRQGAKNLYSKDAILREFLQSEEEPRQDASADDKRYIIVFHCEFSSERAPKL